MTPAAAAAQENIVATKDTFVFQSAVYNPPERVIIFSVFKYQKTGTSFFI